MAIIATAAAVPATAQATAAAVPATAQATATSAHAVAKPAKAATAITYAPLSQPGPKLDVAKAKLKASLHCSKGVRGAKRDVVLLVPGTTVDPVESFSWNYEKGLSQHGIPWCDVTVPNHTDNDIQIAAEYVVHGIRTIYAKSHHKVVLLGWSQGASTLPRWALRWWPDARHKVSSLVGLAPLNNIGAPVATALCATGSCVPAAWQQAVDSNFMKAMNSRTQTFKGIAYTVIYSLDDDVVSPDTLGTLSVLPKGPNVTNVSIQSVCPADVSEHLTIIASPTAYAIAMNAIEHPGKPAKLSQVHVHQPCLPGTAPEVSPKDFAHWEAVIGADVGPRLLMGPVSKEPALACYVTASCHSHHG
jgi:triacylglycerol esterase/lipase EstA (alpha/beta hydrolase family)